jgi:hypothetical protein
MTLIATEVVISRPIAQPPREPVGRELRVGPQGLEVRARAERAEAAVGALLGSFAVAGRDGVAVDVDSLAASSRP